MAKPLAHQSSSQTLGDLACAAIAHYLKQFSRYEKAVLADTDPEDLHQMRVGLRRLRTALQVFAPAIALAKASQEPKVAAVARQLGQLRDLDVIEAALLTHFVPDMPEAEQAALQPAFEALAEQRDQVFKQVKRLLKSSAYKKLKTSLKTWVKDPDLEAIAALPAQIALPDLMLPLVSRLWLHPGWLVGTAYDAATGSFGVDTGLNAAEVDALIDRHHKVLHSLRRQIKRVRYQLKLVSPCYGNWLSDRLASLEAMQETLGELQDSRVLADFLLAAVPEARRQLPTLFSLLASSRDRAWAHWQTLQAPYLAPTNRQRLRLQLLSPEVEAAADTVEAGAGARGEATAETAPPEPAEAPVATPAAAEATQPIAAKRSRASAKRAASAAKTTVKADDTPPAH
jgi:CHAD domain-containing protein